MMIDAIEKLVDLIIKLIKHRQEQDKQTFNSFIDPIYELFEKIHDDYLKSLTDYSNLLMDKEVPLSKIVSRINEDAIRTLSCRTKLESSNQLMWGDDPSHFTRFLQDETSHFAYLITNYLENPEYWASEWQEKDEAPVMLPPRNLARSYCIDLIWKLEHSNSLTREETRNLIMKRVEAMQKLFRLTTLEYYKLQKKLLRLRK
jgi:hypothetical protein